MKSDKQYSKPAHESLLKAVGTGSQPDKAFLDNLQTLSTQAFEDAAASDSQQHGFESLWRHIMKNQLFKLSTAAMILIAVLVGFNMLIGPGTKVAFADVVKPIMNAATISYDFIVGGEEDGVVMHEIVTESRIRRTIGDMVVIMDLDKQKLLSINNVTKEAVFIDITGPLQEGTELFIKFIRETLTACQDQPEQAAENLGEKEINGQTAVGFKVGNPGEEMVIWANAKTAIPVQIDLGLGPQDYVIKNIQFDIPVDVSQVSLQAPDGYTVKETDLDFSSATEAEFIAGLKVWIEVILDGQLPEEVSPEQYMKQIQVLEQKIPGLNLPAEQCEQMMVQFIKSMMFMNLMPVQGYSDFKYLGKGATYGDHTTPIVWYKSADSGNYRVIYADLSVKEVPADQLPN